MKTYGGVDVYLTILHLRPRAEVSGFTTWPLYPRGKSPRYPLDWRLGGHQSGSGHWKREKSLASSRNRTPTPGPPSPTELSRLINIRGVNKRTVVVLQKEAAKTTIISAVTLTWKCAKEMENVLTLYTAKAGSEMKPPS
jgi:hypothetical protein